MTAYRHRTPREKAALESARIAVARAQAHAGRTAVPQRPAVESTAVEPVRPEPPVDTISPSTAWRRRCVEIREEIEAAKRGDPSPPVRTVAGTRPVET